MNAFDLANPTAMMSGTTALPGETTVSPVLVAGVLLASGASAGSCGPLLARRRAPRRGPFRAADRPGRFNQRRPFPSLVAGRKGIGRKQVSRAGSGRENSASARTAARLFLASGALTIVNNYLPGSGHLDRSALNSLGVLAMLVGLLVPLLPWERWPRVATFCLVPPALALVSLGNLFGGVSAYSYSVYFVVIFMWVGLFHPPHTSLWMAPLAVAAYVLPGLLSQQPPVAAVSSVTVAIPICLLVAETIARNVRRAERRGALLAGVARSGRSLVDQPTEDLPGTLTAAAVALGLDAACVLLLDERSETFRVWGALGFDDDLVGRRVPTADGLFGVEPSARLARRVVVVDDYFQCPLASRDLIEADIRSAVAAPVNVEGNPVAVLSAGRRATTGFTTDEITAFELLAIQGGLRLETALHRSAIAPER